MEEEGPRKGFQEEAETTFSLFVRVMAIITDGHGDKKDYQVDDNECKITRFSSSPPRMGFKERGLDNV